MINVFANPAAQKRPDQDPHKKSVDLDTIRKITVAVAEKGRAQAWAARKQRIIAKGNEKRYNRHRSMSWKYDVVGYDGGSEARARVPRDAQTEKRCQMFSVFVTLISLLAIFFFAMTKPVWTTTIQADQYKGLCDIGGVIPLEGTAECKSVRSRENTTVSCLITCKNGVNKDGLDDSFIVNADGKSFNLTCDKNKSTWTYDVNKICLKSPA